jgi:hypothetical protein
MESRELAHRSNDGIHVSLVWNPTTDSVSVTVYDERLGSAFELVMESGAEALDAFRHPYAYAAWRGVDYEPVGVAA